MDNNKNNIAPWLQGLDDGWVAPAPPQQQQRQQQQQHTNTISSASHDASSLRQSTSRIPRRSLSGLHSSISSKRSDFTPKRRPPLAQLNSNDTNTLQRHGSVRIASTRSLSEASEGSPFADGTVQQRSKSASPPKKQETMEWKRRLLNGNVGYGDQTDLFGANGLENIFARGHNAENQEPKPKNRMSWLPKSDAPMPSSPPPWPSSVSRQNIRRETEDVSSVKQERSESDGLSEPDGSFRSNPFDLHNTEDLEESRQSAHSEQEHVDSDPANASAEVREEPSAGNRTVSGQTDLEQEDFSPVFISKTKTLDGFDYAALDSHLVKQFNSTKVNLRHPSQEQSTHEASNADHSAAEAAEQSAFTDGPESEALPTVPDISFSENLPTGSPFPNLGNNVETRRGGYSNYGSFKQRPLSPSQSAAEPSLNQSASGLLSPLPSESHQSPARPACPNQPGSPQQGSEAKSRSSGSPLKLFGAHDTFTSNRLLRRMSQLNPDGTLKLPAVAEASPRTRRQASHRVLSDASSFGHGELDDHGFNAEITITGASDSSKSDSDQSPGSEVLAPGSKTPFAFHYEYTRATTSTFKMKRKLSKHSMATSRGSTLETQRKFSGNRSLPATDSKVYAEGKRPPTSPFKNPTPKRRRTLHASELEDGIADMNYNYHAQLQEAVSSRKRRDARPGDMQAEADADVLSQRKILRPRNPTPSQRRRQQIEAELRQAAEDFVEQEPEKLEAVMEQIESSTASDEPHTLQQQAQTLASEVAAFTLNVQKPSGEHEGARKRSVTTQDFLDEAMMVMNLIRAKARPQSNLGSVEESDAEAFGQNTRPDDSDEEQSHLRVSRPPSREGSGWRTRASPSTDARVVSHLQRFQERDERDDTGFIANSLASLQVDDDGQQPLDQLLVVDENSNIRITGPLPQHDRQAQESDSATDSHRSNGSAGITQSTDHSTGRTIGTSSTRKSDNVGTLAPDAVAHLIGEQVGGMTFDREKQRWVRVHKSPPKQQGSFLELPSNVTSDDDPFREISDLPVDEQKELRRISSPRKPIEDIHSDERASVHDEAEREALQPTVESRTSSNETVIPRPVTRDSSHVQPLHSSSVPSRYTGFASSQQTKPETRATSWNDEELARLSAIGKARQQLSQQMQHLPTVQEPANSQEAGNATNITFPSPPNQRLATNARTFHADSDLALYEEDLDKVSGLRDYTALDLAGSDVEDIDSPKLRQTPSKVPFPPSSTCRGAARQMSLRRQTLTNRFTAEAHEASELSLVAPLPGDRMMSLSLSVSRPLSTRQHMPGTDLQSSPSKGGASFLWSDLPEFTVHEEDTERPSEKVLANRLAQHAAAEVNDRYALAVKDLVKILTDVNEEEPYWEDLKRLSLQDRCLASIYGLDDFCTRLQDMDVSKNALTQLNGAPFTTRKLNARSNQLSSLTSWHHLPNLQTVDVSNNRLDSLDGLARLMHLRELRADNNEIAQLDGVLQLDSLIKLRARHNKIRHVDFTGCDLQGLTHLDLTGNPLSSVVGLDSLTALTELKLDGCQLRDGLQIGSQLPNLTSLSLRDCGMVALDVSRMPSLRHLDVDDNNLCSIVGLGHLKSLQTLSMRRQSLPEGQTMAIFDKAFEASTVLLSGNTLPTLQPCVSFLGIRHLELASAGLQSLPDDFGLRFPNLRTLNLNFNVLKDIRPLLNIQKLDTLCLAGNKIDRLRKSVATFAKLVTVRSLELRDTPLTQGLYPSFASTLSRNTELIRRPQAASTQSADEDEAQAQLERARYEMLAADAEQDALHQTRMDEDSKLRRRVYELLLANSCPNLRELDGLAFDNQTPVARDGVWKRLVELGVLRKSAGEGKE